MSRSFASMRLYEKACGFLLALLLLLLPSMPQSAAETVRGGLFGVRLLDQRVHPGQDRELIHATAVAGEVLFIRSSNALYSFAPGDEEAVWRAAMPYYDDPQLSLEGSRKDGDPFVTLILGDGEKLYGLDLEAQTCYRLSLEEAALRYEDAVKLDLSDLVPTEESDSHVSQPLWALVHAGRLYLQMEQEDGAAADLISIDLSTGEKKLHQAAHLLCAAAYEGNRLIALRRDPGQLWDASSKPQAGVDIVAFNPEDDSVEKLGELLQGAEHDLSRLRMSIAYDAEGKSLYLYTDTDVYRCDAPFREARLIGRLPMPGITSPQVQGGLQLLSEGRLALAFPHNVLLRERTQRGLDGIVSLRLGSELELGSPERLMRILMQMDQAVLLRADQATTEGGEEQLASRLLTGQLEADLMPLTVTGFDFDKLIEKGYLLDLAASPAIAAFAAGLPTSLREGFMRKGAVYAVPAKLSFHPAAASAQAFEETCLALPTSFDGLLSFVEAWRGGLSEKHPGYSLFRGERDEARALRMLFLNTYIDQRFGQGQELVLDTPEFRAVMQRIDALGAGDASEAPEGNAASLLALAEGTEEKALFVLDLGYSAPQLCAINNAGDQRLLPLSLPLHEGDSYHSRANLVLLSALSTTRHAEAAIRFVELYLGSMEELDRQTLNLDFDQDVPNPDYQSALQGYLKELEDIQSWYDQAEGPQKRTLEASLAQARSRVEQGKERLRFLATRADLEMLHGLVRQLYLMNGLQRSQYRAFWSDTRPLVQYEQGRLSLDQFIKGMDDRLRLVRMEYR